MAHYPFIGPSYTLASVAADCQSLMNWYLEPNETGQGRSKLILKRSPGIALFCDLTAVGTPIRGLWAGEGRLFAVAGSAFVEIFGDGSYTNRSILSGATTVGNDGNPVSILPNGNQVLIVSAGNVYCDNGAGPVIVNFNPGEGTVNTAVNAVLWTSGTQFDSLNDGDQIVINSVTYVIASVVDATHLLLMTSAGTQNDVVWTGFGSNGTVNAFRRGLSSTSSVFLESGDGFPSNMTSITIAGTAYPVIQVFQGANGVYDSCVITGILTVNGAVYGSNTPVPGLQGTYIDTYYVVCQPATNLFYISANFDGTTWDGADVASKEGYPDDIAAIRADHEQLWILGDEMSGEVWLDTGAALFPFQRDPSRTIHWGCRATWSFVRFGNGVTWVGGDQERGGPIAFYAEGSTPVIISTFAIQQAWSGYATVADAVSYVRVIDNHEILFINFPTANVTWAYDRTSSALLGIPCWHQLGWWNGASNDRHRAAFHATVPLVFNNGLGRVGTVGTAVTWVSGTQFTNLAAGGQIVINSVTYTIATVTNSKALVLTSSAGTQTDVTWATLTQTTQPFQSYLGDFGSGTPNGKVYISNDTLTTDDGVQMVRQRVASHVAGNDNLRLFGFRFEMLVDLGPAITTAPGTITPVLDYSNDGGHTFINPQTRTAPSPGVTDPWLSRLLWWRQGAPRDKVVRLTMTDQTQYTVIDAFFESEAGTT